MNAEELAQWMDDYENAQGWAHEDQLNQRRREETVMTYVPKENTLALHKNKFKKPGSKEPDYRGDALVGGKAWEVGGWKNKDKNGETYIGMTFKVPRDKASHDDDMDF